MRSFVFSSADSVPASHPSNHLSQTTPAPQSTTYGHKKLKFVFQPSKPRIRTHHRQPATYHLSTHAANKIQLALENGWANSTLDLYSHSVSIFLKFCDIEHIPQHLRLPADEFILCAFAASSAGRHAGSTARNRIAALKAWHVIHDADWNGGKRLHYVLNGVENLAPDSAKRTPRLPVNASMVSKLVTHLNLHNPLDAAVAACASVAFWGQCRLGELLPTASSNLTTTAVPARSNLKTSLRNNQSLLLHLPRTKTCRRGETIALTEQRGPTNPHQLIHNQLQVNNLSNQLPLFAYRTPSGICNLSRTKFLRRCNSIWTKLGYPRTTGHSFRIGGTTELLLAGVSPEVVKAMGRWSSDAFHRYWRSLEDVAPLHAKNISVNSRKRKRRKSN